MLYTRCIYLAYIFFPESGREELCYGAVAYFHKSGNRIHINVAYGVFGFLTAAGKKQFGNVQAFFSTGYVALPDAGFGYLGKLGRFYGGGLYKVSHFLMLFV